MTAALRPCNANSDTELNSHEKHKKSQKGNTGSPRRHRGTRRNCRSATANSASRVLQLCCNSNLARAIRALCGEIRIHADDSRQNCRHEADRDRAREGGAAGGGAARAAGRCAAGARFLHAAGGRRADQADRRSEEGQPVGRASFAPISIRWQSPRSTRRTARRASAC